MQPNELDTLKAKYTELGKEIERLEAKDWPRKNANFWVVGDNGRVWDLVWLNTDDNKAQLAFGNCFRTEEEAELKRDLIKALCLAKPFVPKDGETYYYIYSNLWNAEIDETVWDNDNADFHNLAQGNVFPFTKEGKEACKQYGAVLQKYADSLIKQ